MIDQYHLGESGSVFDGRVNNVDLGWDVETCRDVAAALSTAMMNYPLGPDVYQRLRCAAADLDFRAALAVSRDRHPANHAR